MYGFGEKIKRLRQSKYLSQSQLASQLGVSTSAISQYETEVRIPRDEVKIRIAEFFETEVAHIFF
ncbi:helix-turn-helix domain-containing protein [Gemella sanguinis]|uniref:helix-turn-helix domain-containing protein n=1 Tax=Gemella sanguinis TaxID=84135 RepID=UPI00352C37C8